MLSHVWSIHAFEYFGLILDHLVKDKLIFCRTLHFYFQIYDVLLSLGRTAPAGARNPQEPPTAATTAASSSTISPVPRPLGSSAAGGTTAAAITPQPDTDPPPLPLVEDNFQVKSSGARVQWRATSSRKNSFLFGISGATSSHNTNPSLRSVTSLHHTDQRSVWDQWRRVQSEVSAAGQLHHTEHWPTTNWDEWDRPLPSSSLRSMAPQHHTEQFFLPV
jgi:hypothetical protein